ncbi:peptidylprolyl isomerase [Marivirga harenae]|mgnify:CR=1 FL=1|uniref:peptidylprolyl isomerase n=1 Tax=Marivirga harenae TaxID=2010992 RepID=UPI0026E07AFF|nr:peptidylprolyl isomerase [Marivirga harenae]WKV13766.1 peptidylprolyl isomerase [Marivirga harenae]|tara:strand:- start:63442 stop:65589 length:2148 start_codon:yes stop_codon:yes gene_type:complete
MRNIKGLIIPILFIFISSCKTTQKTSKSDVGKPLFTVDSLAIFPDEFTYAYEKSNRNKGEVEPIEEYLDLYINFKLKVTEAKAEGLDTTEAYINELNGYLEEIKKPYLTTEKVNKELVKEAYTRLQQEINASHILIMVDKEASSEDTAKAYQKISEIKEKYEAGESFEALARKYSEDPSAQSNNGLLGWFTAFQMVYPFESAAFETAAGELSPIIRTQFGYHIVKVNDKRETLGRIKIAHIMKRFPPQATKEDSVNIEKEIKKLHRELQSGGNWFSLATKESEDLNTKDKGGSLPWFGAGNLPASLETVAFELEEKGDVSLPVKSPYGWHILKLEDKRGVGSLESMHESLSRRVQRDQRSDLKEVEVIKKLKQENNFTTNPEAYNLLKEKEDLRTENFKKKELETRLFSISGKKYSVNDFLDSFDSSKDLKSELEQYEKSSVIQYEEDNLETKYPEYRLLRQEYKDGLLLFEIMNQKIWSKIGQDSLALKTFYEKNKELYKSNEIVKVAKIVFSDTSAIKPFKNPINGSYFPLTQKLEYRMKMNLKDQLEQADSVDYKYYISLQIPENLGESDSLQLFEDLNQTFGNMEVVKLTYSDENKIYLQLLSEANELLAGNNKSVETASIEIIDVKQDSKWKNKTQGDYIKTVTQEGMIELNYAVESIPPKQKSFEEARAEVMEDYQKHLEDEWIRQLKEKYEVSVNESVLNKIKSEIEK